LEALAAGIPVIVTPGVALADMIAEQQLGCVAELNIDAIATSIQQILAYPQEAKTTGDRARQFILENYTWDRVASKMVSVYQDIINDVL
ncbi:glycosyltransferase, partial [Anabaena sp. UHCC 0253]|uniref:glycosyltransferase n=1 Tax=Anabaena sp. UHCC 0253 TaxID=2590019 RepID=UPI001444DF82